MSIEGRVIRLVALVGLTSMVACNNPVGDDDDHLEEIAGVEITNLTGADIARYENGVWNFPVGKNALQLQVGEETGVRIYFVAEDGDRFQLPHTNAEYTINVEFGNPAVAGYTGASNHGHFEGLAAGTTAANIQVLHGGHEDWETSVGLPITVE